MQGLQGSANRLVLNIIYSVVGAATALLNLEKGQLKLECDYWVSGADAQGHIDYLLKGQKVRRTAPWPWQSRYMRVLDVCDV